MTQPTKTPHKHAELIKAWADGAKIESRWQPTEDVPDPMWVDDNHPHWHWKTLEFRIKVEPKVPVVRWLWVYKNASNLWRISTRYLTAKEASMFYSEYKKLEFTKMEFD